MYNLTKTLVAMSLLAPLAAHSLGVGDIKLHSALNQKLNAEIALSLAADENLDDITVTLAAPDKFDKLGIAWSYFLSKVKFQPILKSNGKVVIKMTSDAVVEEPFLDFLVEVSWPKGDIFKEFTVLVDPPIVYQKSNISTPAVVLTTRQVEPRTRIPGASKTHKTPTNSIIDGIYGPTGRRDSLWKVAEKVNKDSDISVQQMMIALYKANPSAFYKKNINALMAGKKLKVPERASIIQLTQKQANNQFNGQMAAWNNKSTLKRRRTESVETKEHSNSNSTLRLAPPVIDDIRRSEALTANATNPAELEHLATENLQLQERLADMEQEFVNLQEILAIKDQQLATMQNIGIAEDLDKDKDISQGAPEPVDINIPQDNASNDLSDSAPVVKEPIVKEATPLPIVTPVYKTPKDSTVAESESNYFYVGLGVFGVLALAGLGGLLWHRRQSEEEINENSMFASSSEIFLPDTDETEAEEELDIPVFDGKSSYDVGTGAVGESSFLSEFTPSDFDVFETDQGEIDPTSETDVYLAYGRYQQAEELMRQAITDYPDKDEYKLKLLEIFYTSENSEGYEKFASELAAQGKSIDLNFWAKVTDMGSELLPSSTLFLSEQSASDFSEANDSDDLSNLNNDNAESSAHSFSSDKDQQTEDFPVLDNGDIPSDGLFNLNNDEESAADMDVSGESDKLDSDENHSEIDFDLSSLSLDEDNKSNESSKLSEASEEEVSDIESVDFDLGSFEPPSTKEETIAEEESDSLKLDVAEQNDTEVLELDVDDVSLEDFTFLEETTDSQKKQSESEAQLADESGIGDFDFDFDEISGGVTSKIEEDSQNLNIEDEDDYDLMVADLTDMDEFETKIDLAKAYIDMGDESVAKDIAQEVLDKGNTAQRNDAQEILDKLS